MKKTGFRMMLVAAIAAFALLFGAERMQAQTGLSDGVFSLPTENFVVPAEAQVLLTTHINGLKDLLLTLTPGTQAYVDTDLSVNYYITILSEVNAGKVIPQSIVSGLYYLASDSNGYGAITGKTALYVYRQQAIDLLED